MDEVGYGVEVNSSGDVYVAGYENRTDLGEGFNILLLKYDSDGSQLWTMGYDGPDGGRDAALSMTVDADDYVYVVGYETATAAGGRDIVLLKYTPEPTTIGLMAVGALALLRRRSGQVLRQRQRFEGRRP
jgi:hypothetical protein